MSYLSGLFNNILKKGSDYRSQVVKLAGGNILAALIPFLFQPVISRLYDANDFSILAWYMTFVSIISVFATGKYELAIIVPASDKEAKSLSFLSFSITVIVSVIVIFLSVIFSPIILKYINTEETSWLYLIGPGVLFFCAYQIFFYLANRYSLYNSMSVSKINQNAGIIFLQLILGLMGAGGIGLVAGRLFGYLVSSLVLGWFVVKYSGISVRDIDRKETKELSRVFSNFPRHLIFSNLLATLYTQMPFIYIAKAFDNQISGQFAFALQMITVPGILISNAIGDVFRQKASELYRISGRFDQLLLKTLRNCFLISVVPFTILIFFSVPIFKFVFGETWTLAGEFATVLSVMAFIGFFITPIDKAAIVVNKTKYEFWYHTLRFTANSAIILISWKISLSVFYYLYLLVIITIVHYFIDLLYSYKFSRATR
jgi:O-antigen/teichoic acid export membrane protein